VCAILLLVLLPESCVVKKNSSNRLTKPMNPHIVYVGPKPFMNYVTTVVMQFSRGANELIVRARGKFIARAVDVTEIATKRFLNRSVGVKNIVVGSEEFRNPDGKTVRVSIIEITLARGAPSSAVIPIRVESTSAHEAAVQEEQAA